MSQTPQQRLREIARLLRRLDASAGRPRARHTARLAIRSAINRLWEWCDQSYPPLSSDGVEIVRKKSVERSAQSAMSR